jgi:hypothetical protein
MSESNLVILKFAEAKQPYFKEKRGKGYIEFGERNDYPDYLLSLYNSSAMHGAIVRNKVKYITGNGWTTESGEDSGFVAKFMLNVLSKKVSLDIETFGGSYLEVIWSKIGRQVTQISHIDYLKIRTNKDNTQFWYKDNWDILDRKSEAEVLPAFDPASGTKKQILFVKEYRPGCRAYPLPSYFSALNYIESDIEVSKHILGNASTGFTPSKLITLPNGEPTDEEKRDTTRMFEKRFTGSDGKKFILSFVQDAARKPIIDDLGASDMTKEDFTPIKNIIQENIYAGHEIPSPSLFGIAQPGKLGGTTELKDAYDIFKNTYANDKQMFLEGVFNMLASYAGETQVLKIIPVNPLGLNPTFTDIKDILPKQFIYELAGVDPTKYPEAQQTIAPQQQGTNEALRSLTGKQHQQLLRIIRQVGQGKLTKEAATVMLKNALGLNDDDIETMLGIDELPIQMSAEDEISVFSQFGEAKSNFSVIRSRQRFTDDSEHELFADVSQIEANVLDLISKDKRVTPEVIADNLKISVKRVSDIISAAVNKGLINVTQTTIGKGDTENIVLERKLTQPISKIVEAVKPQTTEFLIRYSYEWLPEIPANERNTSAHPSREFCRALMSLDRVYSRADIEQISARVGYSVFDRRGGWWNDSGDIKEHCRHRWFSQLVMRKK